MQCITADEHGSYYGKIRYHVPMACLKRPAQETPSICILNYVLAHGLDGLAENDLHELLPFTNAVAAVIIQSKGTLKVMPDAVEIKRMLVQGKA